MASTMAWLIAGTAAWGVLSFGAVYPWAYWPLGIAAAVAGACGLAAGNRRNTVTPLLVGALVSTVAATAAQTLPLSESILSKLTPNTTVALDRIEPAFAIGVKTTHAISINPPATTRALVLFVSFALLMIGSAAFFGAAGAERTVVLLVMLGVVVSLIGIIQKPLYAGKIYGFWPPIEGRNPFGPFVNKNHFAGWMLMCLPLALGYFCMSVARAMRGLRAGLRERALWFSSPAGSRVILAAMAIGTMALALVLTMSRSGIGSMTLSVAVMGWLFVRSPTGLPRKIVTIGSLTAIVVLVIVWVGTDVIARRFATAEWSEINARRGAWQDALEVFYRFPLTGTGINTYGTAMLLFQRNDLAHHYSAAHNDYIQLLAEGGFLVSIPAAFVVLAVVAKLRRRLREEQGSSYYWLRAGAATALVAIALQETVEFSLQIPGNAAMCAVIGGLAIHRRPKLPAAGVAVSTCTSAPVSEMSGG